VPFRILLVEVSVDVALRGSVVIRANRCLQPSGAD
jgi:hypothetical protein